MIKRDNKSVPKNITYARVYSSALEMFGYDKDKAHSWWMNKCKALGDKAPYEMVKEGKGLTLLKWINKCMM